MRYLLMLCYYHDKPYNELKKNLITLNVDLLLLPFNTVYNYLKLKTCLEEIIISAVQSFFYTIRLSIFFSKEKDKTCLTEEQVISVLQLCF